MMFVMLVVGIGLVLAGLLAIGFGIPIKEFSTGNTLIVTGVMGVCTGSIMFALWIAVRELRNVARRLGPVASQTAGEAAIEAALAAGEDAFPSGRDQPAAPQAGSPPPAPPPWQDEDVLRDHPIPEPMFPEDTVSPPPQAARQKRNLFFSSTSRKERDRGQRTSEPLPLDMLSSDIRPGPPMADPAEPQPALFNEARTRSDRTRPGEMPPRRGPRAPMSFDEDDAGSSRNGDQPSVTILKSGIVDGMAYSLYSDGSIEAQMPEGLMRFASIDELRAHLDKRA